MEHDLESRFDRWRRHGDVGALEQVFDRAAPELIKLALHLAPGAAEAEDLVQATFLRALERAGQFDARRALVPWLVGILVHEAARARRERARVIDPERVGTRESVDPAASVADAELAGELVRAVRSLPEPYRGVVQAHVLEGERAVDIAAKLERAPGTVRMQVLRGMELLRKALPPSLATAALLSTGLRGHAAVKARVLARATALAAPLAAIRTPASPWARASHLLDGVPMLPTLALSLGAVSLAVLAATRSSSPDPVPSPRALPAPVLAASATGLAPARMPASGGASTQSPTAGASPGSAVQAPLLRGRVLSADGSPVAGVPVELVQPELRTFALLDRTPTLRSESVASATSDADGRFEFAVERAQPYDLAARAGLFSAFVGNRHAGEDVALVLGADRRVTGRVATPAGAPAADARVRASVRGQRWRPVRHFETVADSEGRYELQLPPGMDESLSVTHSAGAWWDFTELTFDASGECALDVRLEAGVTLTGRVTDAASGAPVEGALVGESWTFQRTASTGADGTYTLAGCTGGHHYSVRAPGYGEGFASALPRGEAGNARLDFALRPACAVRGRVVDEYGDGVADAYVAVTSGRGTWSSTRSGVDGSFTLAGLTPADASAGLGHALLVGRTGFATQAYELPAEDAERLHELPALTLRTPELVAGRALDAQGAPVAGARITLSGWNADRFQWGASTGAGLDLYVGQRAALSDAEGRFWFSDVPPGRYELAGDATGRAESEGQSFVLAAGASREDLIVRFSNHGGTARIFGRVVDEQGIPLANVRVAVEREGLFDGGLPSTDTAADGTFELGGLVEGPFTLWATGVMLAKETLWLDTLLPDVSGGPHEVVLRRGATIEGTLLLSDGSPAIGRFLQPRIPSLDEGIYTKNSDFLGHFRLLVPRDTTWTVDVYDETGTLLSIDGVAAGSHDLVWTLPH